MGRNSGEFQPNQVASGQRNDLSETEHDSRDYPPAEKPHAIPRERPIVFTGDSIREILNSTKTQTRRVVKPNPSIAPLAECPYGEIGDYLWVREMWMLHESNPNGLTVVKYAPYDNDEDWIVPTNAQLKAMGYPVPSRRLRPSIFMPRWASRIDLRITNIRFEQLQAISESDARAEGVSCDLNCRRPFMELWDSMNAKRGYGWDKNPYVWVVEFERIKP